jgi:hypothetical protein
MNRLIEIETQIAALQQERDNLLNSVPELQWITAGEASRHADIVGKTVAVMGVVTQNDEDDQPLEIEFDRRGSLYIEENTKLAVLK